MAKIRKLYDEAIKPDGSKQVIYPITSTRAVYTTSNVTVDTILNEGYRFGGVVLPTDSPVFTDQRVFYGASVPGVYANFGGISVDGGEAIFLMYDGTSWHKGIFGGAGVNNLSGFKSLASISDLPLEETTLGYLIEDESVPAGLANEFLYVWVGENGDTLDGKYQNCGQLRGASAYEVAVRNGYEGTEQEWLNDPVNGIKGVGIASWEITPEGGSQSDSGVTTIKVTLNTGEVQQFTVQNGKGIVSVAVVGSASTADSAVNTYRVTYSDGQHFDFNVKNGKGITQVVQQSTSSVSGGDNVIRVEYSEGNSTTFVVKNGQQGNTGSSVDYPFELVNNLTTNDATKGLSAAQGKILEDTKVEAVDVLASVEAIPSNYYTKSETNTLLGAKVNTSDIVDALTSSDATKPLSAKQGKALQDAKVNTSDIIDALNSTATNKPLSANQGKVLNDNLSQLGQEVNGIRETGSVTSSAVGRSWIVLSNPLKAGVQYHLVFSKTAYGNVSARLATAQDESAIIDLIGSLSYFTADTEFDITPSADAGFIALWKGEAGEMTVSIVATAKGVADDVKKNTSDISDLTNAVGTNTTNISNNSASIADIIKILGKGTEEQIETTYVANYRIGINGDVYPDNACKYSAPIPVSRGDVLLLTAWVASNTSPFNKTDANGTYYKPLLGKGVGDKTYLYYCIEDGYIAISCAKAAPTDALKKNSISVLDSISKKIVELEGEPDQEFSTMLPSYVFGTESGSFGGREYSTALYPEAIVFTPVMAEDGQQANPRVQVYARLNGTKRLLFQKSKTSKSASYNTPVESIAKSATIGGEGLIPQTFNLDYIRANRKNGQNKNMFLLIIGASITQQGGYPGYLQMYGDMDNTDIGDINVKVLGSNVGTLTPSITYNYNGETKTITTHTEGRAGWTTYGIANWPFEARADGATNTLGAEGMWYAAGLATKTPFDSNTPGQAWESWTGTTEQRLTAFTSVFGRFKPDYCEELWNALHNFHTRYRSGSHTIWYYSTGAEYVSGATIPAYNSATSDPIMEQFFDDLCYNPDNVFYDRDRARAYTGAYVWSYKTAFSIAKWVERYRTLDDNGNQLTLGEGTGTFVTSSNINNPVCTPTIIFNGMGANDATGMAVDSWHTIAGLNNAIKNLLIDFLDDLHTQLPTAPIGWGCPRQSGVFYPEDWYDFGVIPKITFYSVHRDWLNALMMPEFASLDIANEYNYVPIYFTSSPVSGQSPRYVGDFDRKDSENNLVVTGGDLGHVGEEWEKSVAYQLLSWMYWAFQPTE